MKEIVIKKYAFIDALRGWAILGVIMIHTSNWIVPSSEILKSIVNQGSRGVQLFFVASALTLFLSMSSRSTLEENHILKFFIRRFFRIAPIFYLGMIVYPLINGISPGNFSPYGLNLTDFILTGSFLHAWFPGTINSVVPGGWSIGTEMAFYLLAPFLFLKVTTIRKSLLLLIGALIGSKIVNIITAPYFNSYYDNNQNDLVYYFQEWWFITQFSVFIIGILLYLVITKLKDFYDPKLGSILLVFSLFLFVAFLKSTTFFNLLDSFHLYSFAFFIFALALYLNPNKLFVNYVIKSIGKYSYSLYISHFAVLIFLESKLSLNMIPQGDVKFIICLVLVLLLSLLVSIITYNAVEKPFINLGKKIIVKISDRQKDLKSINTVS